MRKTTVADVMTRDVVTVAPDTTFRQIADVLVARRVSAVPVIDDAGTVVGIVSEADLLATLEYSDRVPHHPLALRRVRAHRAKAGADRAADLMSVPPITITAERSIAEAARVMEAARVKRLPVVNAEGRLVGIVSRHDLVRTYVRSNEELCDSVMALMHALWIDPEPITVDCRGGVIHLSGQVDHRSTAQLLTDMLRTTAGVVDVDDALTFRIDDVSRRVAVPAGPQNGPRM